MQIKTTLVFYPTLVGMAKANRTANNKCKGKRIMSRDEQERNGQHIDASVLIYIECYIKIIEDFLRQISY